MVCLKLVGQIYILSHRSVLGPAKISLKIQIICFGFLYRFDDLLKLSEVLEPTNQKAKKIIDHNEIPHITNSDQD